MFHSTIFHNCVNSLRPRDAYMHHQICPSLVQIMACRHWKCCLWHGISFYNLYIHKIGNKMVNPLRLTQNDSNFIDDIFKFSFLHENVTVWFKFCRNLFPNGPIDNEQALAQIMGWYQTDNKPLSEPMIAYSNDVCILWPWWVIS